MGAKKTKADEAIEEMKESRKRVSFVLKRDEKGEVAPKRVTSPTLLLDVLLKPMSYGVSKQFLSFGSGFDDWSDDDKCKLLSEHIISVNGESFADITVDDMLNMEAWVVTELIQTVALESGLNRLFDTEEVKKALDKALAQIPASQ